MTIFTRICTCLCVATLFGGGYAHAQKNATKTIYKQAVQQFRLPTQRAALGLWPVPTNRTFAKQLDAYFSASERRMLRAEYKDAALASPMELDEPSTLPPSVYRQNERESLLFRLKMAGAKHRVLQNRTELQKHISVNISSDAVDYLPLIGDAKTVYLGEEHYKLEIVQEIEQLILQYKKAYPHKKILLAAEFIDDLDLEGQPLGIISDSNQNHALLPCEDMYFKFFNRLIAHKVDLLGLEDALQMTDGINNYELHRWRSSFVGMKERNLNFIKRLNQFRNNYDVVFVLTGGYHSTLTFPYSMPALDPRSDDRIIQFETLQWLNKPVLNSYFWELAHPLPTYMNKLPAGSSLLRYCTDRQCRALLGADALIMPAVAGDK